MRYHKVLGKFVEDTLAVDAFLQELVEVYRKHGFSLEHEDSEGSFIVQDYNEENVDWLLAADMANPL